ncbi:MAG TPA: hypothetical protein VGH27_14840 [Streptosporangiaceae bacterium]|jgi:hypothetical protein
MSVKYRSAAAHPEPTPGEPADATSRDTLTPEASGAAFRDQDYQDEQADLERLAAALRARGFQANLCTPEGRLPYLDVRNPRATVLAEKVYAQADTFWWSWAEKIAGCDEVSTAAGILARVLRAVGE